MVNILLFVIFFYFLYLTGRGIITCLRKIFSNINEVDSNIHGINLNVFYPIVGVFFIGNLSLLLNFLLPIGSWIFVICIVVISFNILNTKFNRNNLYYYFLYNLPILILPLSSYGIGLGYDAGLYHLNFQSWIRNSKIVFGLSNLHSRYGYSSLFDYVSSNFWLNNDFLLIHFLNLTFIVFFFHIIFSTVNNKSDRFFGLSVMFFGVLDNFGFAGGKNGYVEIESITKYDTVFGIIFFTSFFLIIKSLRKKTLTKLELSLLLLLITLSFQLRPTGLLLLVPLIPLIVKKFQAFRKNKLIVNSFISLNILWMIKHFIITSCFVFPIQITCLDSLTWSQTNSATNEANSISNSLVAFKNYNFDFRLWFLDWSTKFEYNESTLKNLILTILIIFLFSKILTKKEAAGEKGFVAITSIFYFLFWFYNAPDFRFIIPFTLIGVFTITNNRTFSFQRYKLLFITLYSLNLVLLPRIENYTLFISTPMEKREIQVPQNLTYIEKEGSYGVIPSYDEEICWINIKCTPIYSPDVYQNKILNYQMFQVLN